MTELINKDGFNKLNLEAILDKIQPISPYGLTVKSKIKPYLPGQEAELEKNYRLMAYLEGYYVDRDVISALNHVKDIRESIYRTLQDEVLTDVELFEIKGFCIQTKKLLKAFKGNKEFDDIQVGNLLPVISQLDPNNENLQTFYIYDAYSEKLADIRQKINSLTYELKKLKKDLKNNIQETYESEKPLKISLKGDIHLDRSNISLCNQLERDARLYVSGQSIGQMIFSIRNTQEMDQLDSQIAHLRQLEEEEAYQVRISLSLFIKSFKETFDKTFEAIGVMDWVLAKLRQAKNSASVPPEIVTDHIIVIEEGRHLKTEEALKYKQQDYQPISLKLDCPVTSITGANMGGKTVTLKMIGQLAWAVSYGLYVPAKKCRIGLSNHIFVSIGDEQSVEQGLSTFGAEILKLKEAFEKANHRSLILIDELAGGTNPLEGAAITRSVIQYLKHKSSITIITTHFDDAANASNQKLQVIGLNQMAFEDLEKKMEEHPEKGMQLLNSLMDYRLISGKDGNGVPKDAIRIASLMGLQREIINEAKKNIERK